MWTQESMLYYQKIVQLLFIINGHWISTLNSFKCVEQVMCSFFPFATRRAGVDSTSMKILSIAGNEAKKAANCGSQENLKTACLQGRKTKHWLKRSCRLSVARTQSAWKSKKKKPYLQHLDKAKLFYKQAWCSFGHRHQGVKITFDTTFSFIEGRNHFGSDLVGRLVPY